MSAGESAFAEEPVQTTCQMDEPPYSVFETGAEDQSIVQSFQHPEWFSQPRNLQHQIVIGQDLASYSRKHSDLDERTSEAS
uniref:Uncharacterized protein n=1 Tax=Tanacetum cinerariifolium TaxID=118510 RepID=A0A699T9F4_TANCI|nr:hypothetical protein [Tanacetum cinerariifolium]